MSNNLQDRKTYKVVFTGVMAAMVFVATYLRIPFFGSKLSFGNVFCILSGLLFGPTWGGLAAAFGSGIYDLVGGYDFIQALITFASKGAMAWVCAKISRTYRNEPKENNVRIAIGSAAGAITYILLYMLKTFVYQHFVYGLTLSGTWAAMLSKLPASCINGAAAIILAPIIYKAVSPAIKLLGGDKIRA